MNRADTVFQESFLGELQRLENGGEGSEPTAIDKLAAAAGLLDDAPAEPAGEATYDSLLAKLGGILGPDGKPMSGPSMADKAKGAFGKAKESVTGAAKAVGDKAKAGYDWSKGKAQAGGAWMKAHPKTSIGVGAGLAAAGGYAAYRAMKKKDKDD